MEDDVDDVVGDIQPDSPEIVGDVPAAAGAPRVYRPAARNLLVLLVASSAGVWAQDFTRVQLDAQYDDWLTEVGDGNHKVVAFALVSAMLCGADHVFGAEAGRLPQCAQRLVRADVQGYLVYEIVRIQTFAAVTVDNVDRELWCSARDWLTPEGRTLRDLAVEWCGARFRCPSPFLLCPTLAAGVCFLRWPLLHVVAFAGKLNRRRVIGGYPSGTSVARFRQSLAAAAAGQQGAPQPEPVREGLNPWGGMSALQILKWVDFTSYIKNLNDSQKAAAACARLLFAERPESLLHVMRRDDIINKETLRKARVRTDLVAMQVFRQLYPQLERPVFYVWTDSSPQWKGLEYCASSFDTYNAGAFKRRLLPCMSLTRGRTSAVHKCLALLWQCFLMVGPVQLQSFCRSIRAIITDMGVERLIARMPISLLSSFFRHLGSNVFITLDSPWLFPYALGVPGWKHALDLITRRGLWLLPFFPKFIKYVKAIISFLREEMEAVCHDLRKRGYVGLAGMMQKVHLPNFAAWRWSTLDSCLKAISPFVESFGLVFDPTGFRNSRDTTRIKLVCEALLSRAWYSQLTVVGFFCDTLTRLLNWGGGCRCHNAEDPQRQECQFKGRLLPEAYPHAMQHLRAALDEVTSWTAGFLDGNAELLRQGQGCMRGAWLLAKEKLQYLDELPYLLSRLNEAGIRDRCVAQWAEAAADAHDPVSAEFLDESSPLRADVLTMAADGTGMSERLRLAWDSLRQIPIDDTPGEGPHARMRHVQLRTRAATWAWQASSDRLKQNLEDIDTVLPTLRPRTDVQWLWDRWSSVLQVSEGRKLGRNKRMKRRCVEESTYTMRHFRDFRLEDAPVEVDHDAGDDPVGDDDGGPGDGGGEEEGGAADTDGFGRLLREYYQDALSSRVGSFFSVRGEGGEGHRAFQLLAFKQNVSLLRSFRKRRVFVCKMSVMWLDTWAARNLHAEPSLDVFEVSDPEHIDLYEFVRDVDDRRHLYSWSEVPCDVDGCITLVRPVVVEVQSHLNSKKVPVLCLVDALKAAGYEFVDRRVVHKPADALKLVDGRTLASKRHYFQCVLASAALWERGVTEFRSGAASGFYWLLLHNKVAGLTKENMKRRLAELDCDTIELQTLQRPAKLQRHDAGGDDGIVGDDGGAGGPAAPVAEEPADAESSSSDSSSSSSSSSSSPSAGIVGDGPGDAYELPTEIDGIRVHVEEHGSRGDRGFRIKCPLHANCRKYASLIKDPYGYGPRAAELFLKAWLRLDAPDAKAHGRRKPTNAEIDAVIAGAP